MTDTDALADYVRTGNPDAFRHLVVTYQQMVYATCSRQLTAAEDVEDAVQETFLKLARKADTIRSHVGGWLHTCARNTCISMIRADTTRRRHETASAQINSDPVIGEPDATDLNMLLDIALGELDAEPRELLVQRFLVGRSQTELAEAAGISDASMSRRVRRALEQLRGELQRRGVAAPAVAGLASWLGAAQAAVPAALTQKLVGIGLTGVGAAAGTTVLVKAVAAVLLVGGLIGGGLGIFHLVQPRSVPSVVPPVFPAASTVNTVHYRVTTTHYNAQGQSLRVQTPVETWMRADGSNRQILKTDLNQPAEINTGWFLPNGGVTQTRMHYPSRLLTRLETDYHPEATVNLPDLPRDPVGDLFREAMAVATRPQEPTPTEHNTLMYEATAAEQQIRRWGLQPGDSPTASRLKRLEEIRSDFADHPPARVWIDRESGLPVASELSSRGSGGSGVAYSVRHTEYLEWNLSLPDTFFEIQPPEDWFWYEHAFIHVGDQTRTPFVPSSRYPAGLAWRPGVRFELSHPAVGVIATENDILHVPYFCDRCSSDAPLRKRTIAIQLGPAAQKRLDELAVKLKTHHPSAAPQPGGFDRDVIDGLRYKIDDVITGQTKIQRSTVDQKFDIHEVSIGEFSVDQFIDLYLVPHPPASKSAP